MLECSVVLLLVIYSLIGITYWFYLVWKPKFDKKCRTNDYLGQGFNKHFTPLAKIQNKIFLLKSACDVYIFYRFITMAGNRRALFAWLDTRWLKVLTVQKLRS